MSDAGLLTHEYGRASSASRSLSETLLTARKRHAGLPGGQFDVPSCAHAVELLRTLAELLDPANGRSASTKQTWEVPGHLLERVESSGVAATELRRAADSLTGALTLQDDDLATLKRVARAATAEASTAFGRLTDG